MLRRGKFTTGMARKDFKGRAREAADIISALALETLAALVGSKEGLAAGFRLQMQMKSLGKRLVARILSLDFSEMMTTFSEEASAASVVSEVEARSRKAQSRNLGWALSGASEVLAALTMTTFSEVRASALCR